MSEVDFYKGIAEINKIYPTMVIRSQAETIKLLEEENKKLQKKLNQYENPDDLTLFYMWINEKAKDKMKQMQERIAYLERSNNRREDEILSLRDEINEYEDYKARCEKAIEKIKSFHIVGGFRGGRTIISVLLNDLLNILNGSDE